MDRSSFLRSLFIISVSPSVILKLDVSPLIENKANTSKLLDDLKMLTPRWYSSYMQKYGNLDYTLLMEQLGTKQINNE